MEYPKIPREKSNRVKLPLSEHIIIKQLYKNGLGIRAIARKYEQEYGISRRLIQFILFPERIIASRGTRTYKDYYSTEKRREYMKKYRQHQKEVNGNLYSKWDHATYPRRKKKEVKENKA